MILGVEAEVDLPICAPGQVRYHHVLVEECGALHLRLQQNLRVPADTPSVSREP